ncbi:hypothetical protein F5878DRAFT_539372 [Lentinula raphanica]|uniref:Uncharacterized protein n=1 Tax=Lentinula raphanica TaxID=153919 RepID=A0AA38P704_9AGAR|nr:hypothetical protein F5878DRAFT_539372 [Lentinula raphanica]
MSLDQNLFTLQVTPSQTDSTIVDLADPAGNMFYRKQRLSGAVYATRVYDFVTQSLLVAATAPSVTSKVKIIELQNPSVPVELKAFGTFSVKWGFQWKDHQFEWKKEEECYIIRKPDPPVLVAIATRKEIASATSARLQQSAMIQILDYNLNRFDIDDRKGLEFVILTSLLIFLDVADAQKNQNSKNSPGANVVPIIGSGTIPNATKKPSWIDLSPFGGHSTQAHESSVLKPYPPTPPLTPPSGVNLVARMQAMRSVIHEVTVFEEGEIDDYAKFCWRMLRDEAMSFITVRSGHSSQVQKVLEVVEATKRLRFQRGTYLNDSGFEVTSLRAEQLSNGLPV